MNDRRETTWGTATVLARGNRRGVFQLRALSASGALLQGSLRIAQGERVSLVCTIDHEPATLDAEVVRSDLDSSATCEIAVTFREISTKTRDRVHRFVTRTLDRSRTSASPAVLVVIQQPTMHAALVKDVSQLSWTCVSAPTPCAVIRRFADPKLQIVAAIIDARHSHARSMLGYLAREHGSVRRVLLLSDRGSDATLADDIASELVQVVLVSSWQRAALVAAVGVGGRR